MKSELTKDSDGDVEVARGHEDSTIPIYGSSMPHV
jgi:hypothetical protein